MLRVALGTKTKAEHTECGFCKEELGTKLRPWFNSGLQPVLPASTAAVQPATSTAHRRVRRHTSAGDARRRTAKSAGPAFPHRRWGSAPLMTSAAAFASARQG